MPDAIVKEPVYSGQIRHTMDGKHRVTLPSRWRGDNHPGEFYLLPDESDDFLNVVPPTEFLRVDAELMLNPAITALQRRETRRFYFSKAQLCALDSQHRLLIPEEFCQRLGFESELVLIGAMARIEIWTPARWQEACASDSAASCRAIIDQIGG